MESFQRFFNPDRKLSFIEEYSNKGKTEKAKQFRIQHCFAVFNNISTVENDYGKDFCEFLKGSQEVNDIYLLCLGKLTASTLRYYTPILKAYIKWCYRNGYIDAKNFKNHEFSSNYARILYNKENSGLDEQPTTIIANQMIATKNSGEYNDKNFIFEDEESFIGYIRVLFKDDKYIMAAAVAILLYYQFDSKTIRDILKSDVDIVNRTVLGISISNADAFSIICDAERATEYTTTVEYSMGVKFERTEAYVDSPYLLRNTSRGDKRGGNRDGRIGETYVTKLIRFEKDAAKTLKPGSPYEGIFIKSTIISKLKSLYEIKRDESIFGVEYAKNKANAKGYTNIVNYNDYCVLASKMKPIVIK